MKKTWIEITCDTCGNADYYLPPYKFAKKLARDNGWIITADDKHYDTEKCYKERFEIKR